MKRLILTMSVTFLISGEAFAESPKPEECFKVFNHFIGTWVSDLKMDGEVHRWEITLKPSATGRCQVMTVTVDGEPYEQGLYGYDPGRKCWVGTVFWASGRVTTELYQMDAYKAIKARHGKYTCGMVLSILLSIGHLLKRLYSCYPL